MNYRRLARRDALRYGVNPWIFQRQIQQESGFRPGARSGAGAQGIAQIMPGTARAWGVNPNDPRASLDAAAKHLAQYVKQYGGYENALRAYNAGPARIKASHGYAETNAYVAKILRHGDPGAGGVRPGVSASPGLAGTPGAQNIAVGSPDPTALLAALQQQRQAPPQSTLQAPAVSAHPVLPQGAQLPVSGGGPAPPVDVSALLDQIRTTGGDVQLAPGYSAVAGGAGSSPTSSGNGRVVLSPGADRPGVRTHGDILNFARQVSGIAGETLRIGTGTRHSRLTVNGTVSDHWRGEGVDIPRTGADLVKIGQAALIAAGMDPKQARRQHGGGYNVGPWQIIFATNAKGWGDHTTHLHIGRRRG